MVSDQVAIHYTIFSVILLLILTFHVWRLNYINKTSTKPAGDFQLFKYLQLSHVSYVIIILPTIRCILMTIWHFLPSILNTYSCTILLRIDASIWFATMGFIHLFVAMRSRLHNNAVTHQSTIWLKIGLGLILLDFFSVGYILSGKAFTVLHINNTCKPTNISIILIIGTMVTAVVIGLYSLFVFVIPLQAYIKLEGKLETNDTSLKRLVIKIIIYSTIMTLSTVAVTFVVAFIEGYVEIVTALDNIINSYCILLQFRDIDVDNINCKCVSKMISYLQCKCIIECHCSMCCIHINEKTLQSSSEITMTKIVKLHKKQPTYVDTLDTHSYLPKLSIHRQSYTSNQNSFSTTTRSSNHMEISMTEMSNFHDDRKKYIQTVLPSDKINNGVTGKFVALPIAETAYIFWQKNMTHLTEEEKLEIACAIFFEMTLANVAGNHRGNSRSTKDILKKYLITNQIKMEALSMRFLDMLEWLIKHLLNVKIDLFATLQQLGKTHMIMDVDLTHFGTYLSSIHLVFEQYFENKYSIKEKYAMDKIFTISSQIMTGQDIHNVNIMSDFTDSFDRLDFITSLDVCLKSTVGTNYLHRFLQQTFCDELVIWLQSMKKFNLAMSDKERFMIAKRMRVNLIQPIAPFCINISHETRQNILQEIKQLEEQFSFNSDNFKVSAKLFDQGHAEIIRLIEQNHWKRFVDNINTFKNSSINLH